MDGAGGLPDDALAGAHVHEVMGHPGLLLKEAGWRELGKGKKH